MAEAARIGDAVLDWLIQNGFLDGDDEYYVRDAIEALDSIISESHPAQAVTEAQVEAVVQAVRKYTRETLFIDEHRDLVRAALTAAQEASHDAT